MKMTTSFYKMMKLMENAPYQGAPEDFGDTPEPEEDTQGMGAAEMQENPLGPMAADFPALSRAAEADPEVAEELKRLFNTMSADQFSQQDTPYSQPAQPPAPGGQPPQGDIPFMRK